MSRSNRIANAFLIAGLDQQVCTDATQEEIYLEEVEEELRIVLLSDAAPELPDQNEGAGSDIDTSRTLQLELSIEDLIVGDADDTPVDEGTVATLVQFAIHNVHSN